jgi:hypothetical protein
MPNLLNLYLLIRHYSTITGRFRRKFGYLPDLTAPVTFNEKIQWRKIHQHNPYFIRLLDKLDAQNIVRESGIDVRFPQVYWQGLTVDEIPYPSIPAPFVLKTNHGCGFNSFVPDHESTNFAQLSMVINKRLKRKFGKNKGEWAYSYIAPKVYAEEWITTQKGKEPVEYKFYVFNCRVEYIFIIESRFSAKKTGYFDRNFVYTGNVKKNRPIKDYVFPKNIFYQIEQVEKLAEFINVDYIRIDFLEVDGVFIFNEFSLYCRSGFHPYTPQEFDKKLGEKWILAD